MQGPGDAQGKKAAPDPGGDAQEGEGQQAGIRGGQAPQGKHGRAGDEAEDSEGLQTFPDVFQPGTGHAQQMLRGMTRGKTEKNEAKGKEQPVHKNAIRILASAT